MIIVAFLMAIAITIVANGFCWMIFVLIGALLGFPQRTRGKRAFAMLLFGPIGLAVYMLFIEEVSPTGPPPLPSKIDELQFAADRGLRRVGQAIKAGAGRAAAKAHEVLNKPPAPPEV